MIGSLENGAKTVQYVSELYAYIFTIPIFKCLVDFRGIFYVVKMSFFMFSKKCFGRNLAKDFFLENGLVVRKYIKYCENASE